ncbi:hypothetical protein BDZ45DRAFT_745260 [Acephala macrosclerotiorum]|nr:hypothetical protein BDZ45DRAFT_745260 [Acephala macrosclerotiorum]
MAQLRFPQGKGDIGHILDKFLRAGCNFIPTGPCPVPDLGITIKRVIFFLLKVARNLFFHPLSKYPGPKLWAATTLTNNYFVLRGRRIYKVAELHDKYGSIVRVGSNELSYIHEDAWKDIYSSHKTTSELKKFRKAIAPAFSDKSIRDREGILQEYISLMMQRLGEKSKQGVVDLVH